MITRAARDSASSLRGRSRRRKPADGADAAQRQGGKKEEERPPKRAPGRRPRARCDCGRWFRFGRHRRARHRHGRIDVLVNNAGVGYAGPVETIPIDAARELIETNFWGAIRMIRAVLPDLREAYGRGRTCRRSQRVSGTPYQGLYAASKHALGTLSESLNGELSPFGVRVVCVEPGFFSTAISETSNAVEQGNPGRRVRSRRSMVPDFLTSSVETGADPRIVADAIVAAVEDPDSPLHVAVGDDADLLLATWAGTGTYESWVTTTMPFVEHTVGRPRRRPRATAGTRTRSRGRSGCRARRSPATRA